MKKTEKRCTHCGGIIKDLAEATSYKGGLIHRQCIELSFTYPIRCAVTRAIIIEEVADTYNILNGDEKGIIWQ